jgi:hypothetical protein
VSPDGSPQWMPVAAKSGCRDLLMPKSRPSKLGELEETGQRDFGRARLRVAPRSGPDASAGHTGRIGAARPTASVKRPEYE